MSDQGKWFKLWESALDDMDLENLSIHDWFCWARFGVYIKKHGKNGRIRLRGPATALINLFRVPAFSDAISIIKRFPNYRFEETEKTHENVTVGMSDTFSVTCENWNKYQGDWSRDRVRKHRKSVTANVTAQEEKRRDVEEKRGEETIPLPPKAFQSVWDRYPNKDGRKAAERHFKTTVKTMPDFLDIQKALDNYLKSERVGDGFIKNGSTWFNNWRDWIDYKESSGGKHGTNVGTGLFNSTAAKSGAMGHRDYSQGLRKTGATLGKILDGVRNHAVPDADRREEPKESGSDHQPE